MPALKITLSNVTSFLPDILSELKKNHIQAWSDVLKNFTVTDLALTWSILFFKGAFSGLRPFLATECPLK